MAKIGRKNRKKLLVKMAKLLAKN